MPFGPIAYGRKASRTHEARWYLYTNLYTNTNEKKSRGPLDVRYIPTSYPVTGTLFFCFCLCGTVCCNGSNPERQLYIAFIHKVASCDGDFILLQVRVAQIGLPRTNKIEIFEKGGTTRCWYLCSL